MSDAETERLRDENAKLRADVEQLRADAERLAAHALGDTIDWRINEVAAKYRKASP